MYARVVRQPSQLPRPTAVRRRRGGKARRPREVLLTEGHIRVLTDRAAPRDAVVAELTGRLAERAREADLVLISFVGHSRAGRTGAVDRGAIRDGYRTTARLGRAS